MKTQTFIIIILFILTSCKNNVTRDKIEKESKQNNIISFKEKIANLRNSKNKEIIIVAHRADWRNAPENSLQAIQNCIDLGVDMVEIDVRKTKDNQLVIMHDRTIDRTTTGKGFVEDWTLDSLKTLNLKDGLGYPTPHRIPTLKEILELTKGKILVNLDKSYEIFDECFEVIKETNTENQVIIKGAKRKSDVINEFGDYLDKVYFIPVINLSKPNAREIIDEYLDSNPPIAIEFTFDNDTIKVISDFSKFRDFGISIWVNSLWPRLNGGHDDEKAVQNINIYQWYIDNNINIIQTDRPELLLKYLRSKNLHK